MMEPSMIFAAGLLVGFCLCFTLMVCLLFLAEVITDEQKAAIARAWNWLTNNPQAGSDDRGMAEWTEGNR